MKLIIKGDDRKIKRLAKEIRLRAKRDGLKMSTKTQIVEEIEDKPKSAKDVIAIIKEVTQLADLAPYESDTRATVVAALAKRKDELKDE